MSKINVSGLTPAQIFAALYNSAKAQGMGLLVYSPGDGTVEQAQTLIDETRRPNDKSLYLDYVGGRVMKIELPLTVDETTEIDVRLYDRDNGEGAAARALEKMRATVTG